MKNYGDLGGCYPSRPWITPSSISIILYKILSLVHQLLNIDQRPTFDILKFQQDYEASYSLHIPFPHWSSLQPYVLFLDISPLTIE